MEKWNYTWNLEFSLKSLTNKFSISCLRWMILSMLIPSLIRYLWIAWSKIPSVWGKLFQAIWVESPFPMTKWIHPQPILSKSTKKNHLPNHSYLGQKFGNQCPVWEVGQDVGSGYAHQNKNLYHKLGHKVYESYLHILFW